MTETRPPHLPAFVSEGIPRMTATEIIARRDWLVREITELDPKVVSPTTRQKLRYVEDLARDALAAVTDRLLSAP